MYNRYIHQNDGSFHRKAVPEHSKPPESTPSVAPKPEPAVQVAPHPPPPAGVTGFLRNLLPKNFDTGDLIVVLLLLLMAGDCKEEQNTALLTLALYFFM